MAHHLHDIAARLGTSLELLEVQDAGAAALRWRADGSATVVVLEEERLTDLPFPGGRPAAEGTNPSCLILSSAAVDEEAQERFFRLGAAGVVAADISSELLERAIRAVLAGELWMSRKLLSKLARLAPPQAEQNLTPRESDILALIQDGLTNQQIADRLFISRETVRWHVRKLYSKIGVVTRTAAIAKEAAAARGSLGRKAV